MNIENLTIVTLNSFFEKISDMPKLLTEKHLDDWSEGRDKFRFEHLSKRVLNEILFEMEHPNCFGIYGNWGSGKSTFMHYLKKHIEARDGSDKRGKIATVYFEPWKYEYAEKNDLLFALLSTIEKELGIEKTSDWLTLKKLGLSVLSWSVNQIPRVDIDKIEKDMEKWEGYLLNEYQRWNDNIHKFKRMFDEQMKIALADIDSLIVFIDDLDRCLPENAVLLLESIKNFLSVDKTLFVLGIDKRVIASMIQNKYGLYGDYGHDYLLKIIPYHIDLPHLDLSVVLDEILAAYSIALDANEKNAVINLLRKTIREPRKAKHVIHQFCMWMTLIKTIDLPTGDQPHIYTAKVKLFAVAALHSLHPDIFENDFSERVRHIQACAYYRPSMTEYKNAKESLGLSEAKLFQLESLFRFGSSKDHASHILNSDEITKVLSKVWA